MTHQSSLFHLYDSPLLEAAPQLKEPLEALESELLAGAVAHFSPPEGLDPVLVVRWLYRRWLERAPSWRALVHLDPRFLPGSGAEAILADCFGQACEGFLVLDRGWESVAAEQALTDRERSRQVRRRRRPALCASGLS